MPVKTGERRVAWLKTEVLAYRQKLVEDRDQLLARSGYKADSSISKR